MFSMNRSNDVCLILTNRLHPSVFELYEKIRGSAVVQKNSYILFHQEEDPFPNAQMYPFIYPFTYDCLSGLNYIALHENLVPGSTHFPLLYFYLSNPDFDYYWFVEDDVRFTGQWLTLFSDFYSNDSDFISSHLRYLVEEPEWVWWDALWHPKEVIPIEKRVRSFNPIYRISNRALKFIHMSLCDGWCGHHEVVIATLLMQNGFHISDFGGDGKFVSEECRNRYYTSRGPNAIGALDLGTMRYRPVFTEPGPLLNKLYHPIKVPE